MLAAVMFILYFLAATQDIVVDGWALTMLKRRGWASTCNSIGQSLGVLFASTGYYILASRSIVTLPIFLQACSFSFTLATVFVAIFVPEGDDSHPTSTHSIEDGRQRESHEGNKSLGEAKIDTFSTYRQMRTVLGLHAVRQLLLILITWKISFACAQAPLVFKLQELGFSKESMAYIQTLASPVEMIVPLLVAPKTTGERPFSVAMDLYIPRLVLSFSGFLLILCRPGDIGWIFTALVVIFKLLQTALSAAMFTSQLAFFARVSDPAIGGSYMTLLNTVANLGSLSSLWIATRMVDVLTVKSGEEIILDGFYVTSIGCLVAGMIWYALMSRRAKFLQTLPKSAWLASGNLSGKPVNSSL
ncbi:hypothetical protein AAMO2058_001549900 [Amorphochlora amoebiformis]